jgi:hypothetical protein
MFYYVEAHLSTVANSVFINSATASYNIEAGISKLLSTISRLTY